MLEYSLKLPETFKIARPSAIATYENTLIIVSAPYDVLFFTKDCQNI